MTKHKPEDRQTGGGWTKGKSEQSREEGSAWVSTDFLCLKENGSCEVGARTEARPLHSADLLENLVLF